MNKHKLNIHWGNKIVFTCSTMYCQWPITCYLPYTVCHTAQTSASENNISKTANTVLIEQYQVCTMQTPFYIQQTPDYCTIDKQENRSAKTKYMPVISPQKIEVSLALESYVTLQCAFYILLLYLCIWTTFLLNEIRRNTWKKLFFF